MKFGQKIQSFGRSVKRAFQKGGAVSTAFRKAGNTIGDVGNAVGAVRNVAAVVPGGQALALGLSGLEGGLNLAKTVATSARNQIERPATKHSSSAIGQTAPVTVPISNGISAPVSFHTPFNS